MPDRPNVIVIVSDTYRPDHIAANGHPAVRTPELDAWLARAITFDNALVSSFPTIPMRTDWFTGRFSHPRHGWQPLDPRAVTLPGVLAGHGYTCQLIADTTHLLRNHFFRPFTHFHFLRGHEGDHPLARLNEPVRPVVSDRGKTRVEKGSFGQRPTLCDIHAHVNFRQRYEEESHSALMADAGCRWIEDNYRGGPFLLWLDFFDVHEPWFPPRYLLDRYHPGYSGEPMAHPNYGPADAYAPEELQDLQARYRAMCTLLSKAVGRVLRHVEDTGLLGNTIVVFLSDHGMYLGERGLTGKSRINAECSDCFPFYRELARICWSMHVPPSLGLNTVPPGARLAPLVQAPDLMPTVLELCGLAAPGDARIEGRSLAPWLTGEASDPLRDIAITTCNRGGGARMPTVTDGRWALLLREPPDLAPPRLYDLQTDPGQTQNVLAGQRDEARRLHEGMLRWLAQHGAEAPALERLAAGPVGLA